MTLEGERIRKRDFAIGFLLCSTGWLACSRTQEIDEPMPLGPEAPTFRTGKVRWTTELPTRGSVIYGYTAQNLDHVAYPVAYKRRDRAYVFQHSVPLLDLRPGQLLYFQVQNETEGSQTLSDLQSAQVDTDGRTALLTAVMLYVGFGDCHLITMPNGKRLLMDAGWNTAETAVESYLVQHHVDAVDFMLATHIHGDHLGGFVGTVQRRFDGVISSYPPTVFFDSPTKSTTRRTSYVDLVATLSEHGIQFSLLHRGSSSKNFPPLAVDPNVHIRVLAAGTPPGYVPATEATSTDINNDSIVLRFSYGDVDFIIGGDAEEFSELSMVANNENRDLEVEYYKMHHHGLPDANSASFVEALRPRVAFLPNARAAWHPPESFEGAIHQSVTRLRQAGAHVYAPDEAKVLGRLRGEPGEYHLEFVTDGVSYEVRLERALGLATKQMLRLPDCIKHSSGIR